MVLFSAFKIAKSFGSQTLFKELTFSIESGQKIGLIGPNGAGKSTLLTIIAKKQSVDKGELSFSNSLRLGYLEQSPKFNDESVYEAIVNQADDPYDADTLSLAQELISKLDLENSAAGTDRNVNDLSGGWKKRVALARELIKRPNLLLLDEPTNHLDLPSIIWLEEFLERQTDLAVLTVTHDRLFLQNTSNMIFDLDRRNPDGLIKYEGSYADFLDLKESLFEAQKTLESAQKNILRRETAWLRRGAKARQTKQKARIERAGDLKDQVKELSEKNMERKLNVDFGEVGRSPKKIIEAKNISKAFDHRYLFKDFSFILGPKTRIGILGSNGCGKSTLIRTLIGEENPDSGSVSITDQMTVSYFEQQKESLNHNVSVLKTICPEGDYVHLQGKPVFAKSYLSRFHFRADQMDLPVGKLSGGEQSRLRIAQLMMNNDPVLILDEPTNDLDIATLDVLQEALINFPGAVILVTHDRYFMDQVANQILAFTEDNGQILSFANFFQWDQWFQEKGKQLLKTAAKRQAVAEAEAAAAAAAAVKPQEKKKLSYKDQRELDNMEATIQGLEAQAVQIEQQLINPENLSNYAKLQELNQQLDFTKKEIERLYERWQELSK